MSNPSLLCVPYRFKTSKLYSQIPDSGLGDFTVTRSASNSATRVNAAGFIETVADNVPRLDYPLGGITAGCPALLVEPSAQNLALRSEDFTTTWNAVNTTPTPNQTTSPDNTLTADRISITSNGGYIRQIIATSNSTTYTASCFVKNDTVASGDTFRFYFNNNTASPNAAQAIAIININAGTVTTSSGGGGISAISTGIENYGNGWYRVRVTFTLGASAGSAGSEIGFDAPTATRTFFAWGAQFETGSIATSYIPTAASPVTRGAETISKTGVSSLIGQTEGTIYAEVDIRNSVTAAVLGLDNNSATDFIIVFRNSSRQITVVIRRANGSLDSIIASSTLPIGVHKIALGYTNGNYALYINGSLAGTSTNSVSFPISLTACRIGANAFGDQFNDRIRAHALYPTRLPNTGPLSLQSLTQ